MSVENEHPNPGEQGRAAHSTGSTSQGGSNYGQGSSHLGGESYQQGSVSNKGANYENESSLGNSSTGTNFEGSSSSEAGTGGVGDNNKNNSSASRSDTGWKGGAEGAEQDSDKIESHDTKKLFEGDNKDTSLEQSSGMDEGKNEAKDADSAQSRSWSAATDDK